MPHVHSLIIQVALTRKTATCSIPFFDATHVVPQGYESGMRQKSHDSDEQRFSLNANGAADISYLVSSLGISFLQNTSVIIRFTDRFCTQMKA